MKRFIVVVIILLLIGFALYRDSTIYYSKVLREGEALVLEGKLDEAIEKFKILKGWDGHEYAYNVLIVTAEISKYGDELDNGEIKVNDRTKKALPILKFALETGPDHARISFLYTRLAYAYSDYLEVVFAIEPFYEVLKTMHSNPVSGRKYNDLTQQYMFLIYADSLRQIQEEDKAIEVVRDLQKIHTINDVRHIRMLEQLKRKLKISVNDVKHKP